MSRLIFLQIVLLLPSCVYYMEVVLSINKSYGLNIYKAIHFSFFILSLMVVIIGIKIIYKNFKYEKNNIVMIISPVFLSFLAIFFAFLDFNIVYYMIKDIFIWIFLRNKSNALPIR